MVNGPITPPQIQPLAQPATRALRGRRRKKKRPGGGLSQEDRDKIKAEQERIGPQVERQTALKQRLKLAKVPKGARKQIIGGLETGRVIGEDVGITDEDFLGRLDAGRAQETTDLLESFKNIAAAGGQRSPLAADLLARREAGLEGLTGAELTALREQGQAELDRTFQGQQRALAAQQQRAGIRGAAAGAGFRDIAREQLQAGRGLERDIFLANVAERQRRLEALDTARRLQEQQEFGQELQGLAGFGTALSGAQQFERQGEQFNLGQLAAEIAARSGARLGGIGLISGLQSEQAQRALQEQAIQAQIAANQAATDIAGQQLELQREFLEEERKRREAEAGGGGSTATDPTKSLAAQRSLAGIGLPFR